MDLVNHFSTGYGITIDNLFISIELANKLLDKTITLCGTKKPYVPKDLLPARHMKDFSSIFAFMENETFVFLVPKKNAVVIFLSTEHNDVKISGGKTD